MYVDDLKMAGNKENLPGMWDKLMEKMMLEKPKRFEDNQYLGQSQRLIEPAAVDVERMGKRSITSQ